MLPGHSDPETDFVFLKTRRCRLNHLFIMCKLLSVYVKAGAEGDGVSYLAAAGPGERSLLELPFALPEGRACGGRGPGWGGHRVHLSRGSGHGWRPAAL